jgi:putative nucleotidyltransferase with HDIG domain
MDPTRRSLARSLEEVLGAARDAWSGGRWDEALSCYEEAIPAAVERAEVETLADVFRSIGNVHRERGGLELAEEAYGVSLAIAEANGLAVARCSARMGLAAVEYHRGSLAAAECLYIEVRSEAHLLGQSHLVAMIDQNLGAMANIRGDVDAAIRRYEGALAHFESTGDDFATAGVLTNLGMAHVDVADWSAAERCFDRALSLSERLQAAWLRGHIEINRAELYARSRDTARAKECCDRAFDLFGRIDSESGLAETHKWYGVIYRDMARGELAETHLRSAVEIARECDDRLLEAEALAEWAVGHLAVHRNAEALQCLNGAHRIFEEMHARRELLDLDRRLDQLEETYLRVVRDWADSIESKDRYTAGHCERVANYACLLAQHVGITGRDLTWLRMGGYLHDVGKISVPAEVLNKAGSLTPEEWASMRSHTLEGDRIVAELNFPWDIRPAVRWHHERWDGSGYPDGLAGEAIPLTARIMCVADVYDALTTTRSYRAAFSREKALGIMQEEAGRIFDPELYLAFRSLVLGRKPMGDGRFPIFGPTASAA